MDYILSFRKNESSKFFFADTPKITRCSDGALISIDHLVEETRGQRVLFLIHGYSNSEDNAVSAYSRVIERLRGKKMYGCGCKHAYQKIVVVLWPGHTSMGFWLAVPSANKSGKKLADVLTALRADSIDLHAHSLGNRVMFQALAQENCPAVRNAISLAAAIDDESLEHGKSYYLCAAKCKTVFVGYSRRDEVLGVWYRRFGSLPWNLFSGGDTALGFNGPTNPEKVFSNVQCFDGTLWVGGHSEWKTADKVYEEWGDLVKA